MYIADKQLFTCQRGDARYESSCRSTGFFRRGSSYWLSAWERQAEFRPFERLTVPKTWGYVRFWGATGRVSPDSAPVGAENARFSTILGTDRQNLGRFAACRSEAYHGCCMVITTNRGAVPCLYDIEQRFIRKPKVFQ